MHKESFELVKRFVDNYLSRDLELSILDVGSMDFNGSLKPLFSNTNWSYFGLDIAPGKNVDFVSASEYDFNLENKFDVIVSANCLEHVNNPFLWISEVKKYLKPRGILCIVVPFSIPEHRYPVDCWRILPDGFNYLVGEFAGLDVIECFLNNSVDNKGFFGFEHSFTFKIPFLNNYFVLNSKAIRTYDTCCIAINKGDD